MDADEGSHGIKRKRTYELSGLDDLGPELEVPRETYDRCCLRCDRAFTAPNRYFRLCSPCRKWASSEDDPNVESW